MSKLVLNNIEAGYLSNTAYNANNNAISTAFENTLSRDGTSPNQMGASLDMNSNRILNLPDAVSNQEPVTFKQLQDAATISISIPMGTTTSDLVDHTSSGTGAIPITVETQLSERVSVKNFGAIGDGTANDTAAFSLAIAAINDGTIKTLHIPSGNYRISTALPAITANNWAIVGDGHGASRLFIPGGSGTLSKFFTIGSTVANAENWSISGLWFECMNTTTMGSDNPIIVEQGVNGRITDIYGRNVAGFITLGTNTTLAHRIRATGWEVRCRGDVAGTVIDVKYAQVCTFSDGLSVLTQGTNPIGHKGIHIHPSSPSNLIDSIRWTDLEFNYPNFPPEDILVIDATNGIIINQLFSNCVFDQALKSCIKIGIGPASHANARINNILFSGTRTTAASGASSSPVQLYDQTGGLGRRLQNIEFNGGTMITRAIPAVTITNTTQDVFASFIGVAFQDADNVTAKPCIVSDFGNIRVIGCKAQSNNEASSCTFNYGVRFTNASAVDFVVVGNDFSDCTVADVDISALSTTNEAKKIIGQNLAAVKYTTNDINNVKNFGARGDGTTNDTSAIQAAIAASYGKSLYFPSGTYKVSALTVSGEITLLGEGPTRTIISLISGSNTVPLTVNNANNLIMRDIAVDGNKSGNPAGTFAVSLTGTNTKPAFTKVRFFDAKTSGLGVSGTCDYLIVKDCIASSCDLDGFVSATATKVLFEGNSAVANGRFGILVTASLARIIGNVCDGNATTTTGGAGIGLVTGAHFSVVQGNLCFNNGVAGSVYAHGIQLNSTTYCSVTGNYCAGNIGNGIDLTTNCTYNTVTGNTTANNYDVGIAIDSLSHYCSVVSNVVKGNLNTGIYSYASFGTKVIGNQVIDNGLTPTAVAFAGVAANPFGILFDGYTSGGVDYYGINGSVLSNEVRGSTHASGAGLKIVAGGITPFLGLVVNDNAFAGNTAPQLIYPSTATQSVQNNVGWVTSNRGTATIGSGTTSVVVTHGLDITPAVTNTHVTAANAGTNDPGDIWVDTFTATTFVIQCRNDPGVGGILFGWEAGRGK